MNGGLDPGEVEDLRAHTAHLGEHIGNGVVQAVEEPLHELAKSCEVVIVGCKPEEISSPDVVMGLSDSVEAAIPKAIDIILKEIGVL